MRLACVLVPFFPAAALVRSDPGLRDRSVAVIRGVAPARVIVDATAEARAGGVGPGMSESHARARCPELIIRPISDERDRLAQVALLAAALGTSPRVEDGGPGVVYVDLDGLGRIFGDESAIGERLCRQARGIGLPASVGIASNRASARAAARLGRRVTRVASGDEVAALGDAPVTLLELSVELQAVLTSWGVRTVGDLARLPRTGLAERLGAVGLAAHDRARGVDGAPFRVYTPPPFYQEAQDVEWEIASLDHLEPIVQGLLDRLVTCLRLTRLAADRLTLALGLANGGREERVIALAHPMVDVRAMWRLLRLELEAHPVSGAVVHVGIRAHPARVHIEQGRLGQPPGPGARELTAVLGRLTALVGPANLGSPAQVDSHRPDAFQVMPFDLSLTDTRGTRTAFACPAPRRDLGSPESPAAVAVDARQSTPLVLRRLRPSWPADVEMDAERPAWVTAGSVVGHVVAAAGPWRTSGEWWRRETSDLGGTGGWARDEWDIALSDHTVCRLVWDHRARVWVIDGIYD